METKNLRKERGLVIAKDFHITKENDKTWLVPSQTNTKIYYIVKSNGLGAKCNCPDYKKTNCKCKHIFAVEYIVTQTTYADGTLKQKVVKKTYSQNWSNYNQAQKTEKDKLMRMLSDLVKNIQEEDYKFGRPKTSIQDILYSMIFKVYSGVSGRRFTCDMQLSKELEFINKEVPFTTLKDYFNKTEVTEVLHNLIKITSQPLKEVETNFAIDSSGFGTSINQNWHKYKHSTQERYKKWVKCHIVSGVHTNIIPAVKITSEFDHDSPQLKELLDKTNEVFTIEEFSGDKAYSSRKNLQDITNIGAVPFIPFKKNVTGKTNRHGIV